MNADSDLEFFSPDVSESESVPESGVERGLDTALAGAALADDDSGP